MHEINQALCVLIAIKFHNFSALIIIKLPLRQKSRLPCDFPPTKNSSKKIQKSKSKTNPRITLKRKNRRKKQCFQSF